MSDTETTAGAMVVPAGKYEGKRLDELTPEQVHLVWAAWNGSRRLKAAPFFAVLVAEKEKRGRHPNYEQMQEYKRRRLKKRMSPESLDRYISGIEKRIDYFSDDQIDQIRRMIDARTTPQTAGRVDQAARDET